MGKTSAVITYLEEMRNALKEHIGELKSKENGTGKNLVKPFSDISNKVNIVIPITHCIQERLQHFKINTPATPKDIWAQVLKTVYRDFLFVATMSTIEYYFPRILLQYPKYQSSRVDKKTMHDLIDWASREGILADEYLWRFANYARNDIVHRNAFAKSAMKSPILDFPIEMVEGQQLSGKLRSLLSLTKHVETSFFNAVFSLQE